MTKPSHRTTLLLSLLLLGDRVTYHSGHGWRGDYYTRVRGGLSWMIEKATGH